MRRFLAFALGAATLAAGAAAWRSHAPGPEQTATLAARAPAPMPAVSFTSHRGEPVRFADAVRDRVVVLAFGYARCNGSCPRTNANLSTVQRLLGERMGRDISILTVSLDPENDTPQVLAHQAASLGAGPGWTFLTGTPADVDALRRHFGLFDRYDPGAPRTSHSAVLMVGDAASGRWLALPGLGEPEEIARAALRLAARRTRASPESPPSG